MEYLAGYELGRVEISRGMDIEIEGSIIKSIKRSSEESNPDKWVIPAFTDPHTHSIFCGKRENEIDRRKEVGYQKILEEGGGIYKSIADTSSCSEEQMLVQSKKRIVSMMKNGTAIFEIKTGYGKDLSVDKRMLAVMEKVEKDLGISVKKTLLAHVIPGGYSEADYVNEFTGLMEEERARIDFVDVFVDTGAFSVASAKKIFTKANEMGVGTRVHMNEIANLNGISELSKLGIRSWDHMIETREEEIALINAVITFLPLTSLFLGKNPIIFKRFLESNKIIAIGSDLSPNSYVLSLLFVLSLARQTSPFTLSQLINMATINSTYSLGLSQSAGTIHPGKKANLIVLSDSYENIGYIFGEDPIEEVIVNGKGVRDKSYGTDH